MKGRVRVSDAPKSHRRPAEGLRERIGPKLHLLAQSPYRAFCAILEKRACLESKD